MELRVKKKFPPKIDFSLCGINRATTVISTIFFIFIYMKKKSLNYNLSTKEFLFEFFKVFACDSSKKNSCNRTYVVFKSRKNALSKKILDSWHKCFKFQTNKIDHTFLRSKLRLALVTIKSFPQPSIIKITKHI